MQVRSGVSYDDERMYQTWVDKRGQTEVTRLLKQHRIQQYAVGPHVVPPLPSSPVILDVGSGPSDWLMDLSAMYPSAELHGIDMSDKMFPPPHLRPANVQLRVQDIFNPFPNEWKGKFDLVNARNVFFWIPQHKWNEALQVLKSLLKPGGWLQSVEYGPLTPNTGAVQRLLRLFTDIFYTLGLSPGSLPLLSSYIKPAGFVSVSAETVSYTIGNKHPVPELRNDSVDAIRAYFDVVKFKGRPGEEIMVEGVRDVFPSSEECDQLIEEALAQVRESGIGFLQRSVAQVLRPSLAIDFHRDYSEKHTREETYRTSLL